MSGPNRKREVQVNFRVSPQELEMIEQKMAQLGTSNREAYLRKMALDGYVVKLELPELKELVLSLIHISPVMMWMKRRFPLPRSRPCAPGTRASRSVWTWTWRYPV